MHYKRFFCNEKVQCSIIWTIETPYELPIFGRVSSAVYPALQLQCDFLARLDFSFRLDGMTIVDGLLITGSNSPVDEINTRLSATWYVAPLRWSVNYTTAFKEWLPYRNKQGEIHVRIM